MHSGDEPGILNREPQWQAEVVVAAPLHAVWDAVEDLSLIPDYHPEARNVQFLSGHARRATGVRYKCVASGGDRSWFVEEVVKHDPFERTVAAFVNDSRGTGARIEDFLTEISVEPRGSGETLLRLRAWYRPRGWLNRAVNPLVTRRGMRTRAVTVLEGLKGLVERHGRARVG